MSDSNAAAFVTFPCGHCARSVRSPAALEGRPCRCPHCRNKVVVPALGVTPESSEQSVAELALPAKPLRGAGAGLLVSLLIHAVMVGVLAMLVLQPERIGFELIASFLPEQEESEISLLEFVTPSETPPDRTFDVRSDALVLAESSMMSSMSPSNSPSFDISGPVVRDQPNAGKAKAGGETGLAESGFSATTVARLKLIPAAKRGDYEIALVWDGPSDLDLHVIYHSLSGKTTRVVNFLDRGKAATGLLDVDQNAILPYANDPIEHVRWNTKSPPSGNYDVFVHAFAVRNATPGQLLKPVAYTVEVKTPDGVETHKGVVGPMELESVCSIQIGGAKATRDQQQLALQLLNQAQGDLAKPDERSQALGRGKLNAVIKRYPNTPAAKDARELIRE